MFQGLARSSGTTSSVQASGRAMRVGSRTATQSLTLHALHPGGAYRKPEASRVADPRQSHAGIFFPDLILRTAHWLRCAPCGAQKTARNTRLSCAAPAYFPPIKGLCHDRA